MIIYFAFIVLLRMIVVNDSLIIISSCEEAFHCEIIM